jgi:GT2 family glycosyltransferase
VAVSVVIVGIGQWLKYTRPYIKALARHEPEVQVVVVDNGSPAVYPDPAMRFEETVSYAKAINAGLKACEASDWYVISNNDVRCEGPFVEQLEKLDPWALFGNQLQSNDVCDLYVDGWIYFLSRQVLEAVGYWDEKFLIAAYEDIDYSRRAAEKGIPIRVAGLPFKHLAERIRYTRPNYWQVYEKNRDYYMEKHGISVTWD